MSDLGVRRKLLQDLKRYASEGVAGELRELYGPPPQAGLEAEEPAAAPEGMEAPAEEPELDVATLMQLLGE